MTCGEHWAEDRLCGWREPRKDPRASQVTGDGHELIEHYRLPDRDSRLVCKGERLDERLGSTIACFVRACPGQPVVLRKSTEPAVTGNELRL